MRSAGRSTRGPRLLLISGLIGLLLPGIAGAAEFRCLLKDVVVWGNRVHCQCAASTPDGGSSIRYFAVSTAEAHLADRFSLAGGRPADRLLAIGTTALVSGRKFIAGYTSGDVSGSAFGCSPGNCRKLTYFGIE